jgi:pyruvate dehydrogenase E1 component alpha subunit
MAKRCRKGDGPVVLTARTFRMGGHATHDEAEARAIFSPEEFSRWGERDPIGTFEAYLTESGPALDRKKRSAAARREANRRLLEEAEQRVTAEVEAAAEEALDSRRTNMPDPEDAVRGVYAAAPAGTRSGNGRDQPAGRDPKRPSRNGFRRPARKLDARPKRRLS